MALSVLRCGDGGGEGGEREGAGRRSPSLNLTRNLRPLVAKTVLQVHDQVVLILRPGAALDGGVQVVIPALPALLAQPSR